MDANTFDALVARIFRGTTRRDTVKGVLAGAVSAAGVPLLAEAKNQKSKHRKGKGNEAEAHHEGKANKGKRQGSTERKKPFCLCPGTNTATCTPTNCVNCISQGEIGKGKRKRIKRDNPLSFVGECPGTTTSTTTAPTTTTPRPTTTPPPPITTTTTTAEPTTTTTTSTTTTTTTTTPAPGAWTINGSLEASDATFAHCGAYDPSYIYYYDTYSYEHPGGLLTLYLSAGFDSYLFVYSSFDPSNPCANIVAKADDDLVCGGTNSRLETDLPAGTYTLVATSYGTVQTGDYTLTAELPVCTAARRRLPEKALPNQ